MNSAQNYTRAKMLFALKHLSKATDALAELEGRKIAGKMAGAHITDAHLHAAQAHTILQRLLMFGL